MERIVSWLIFITKEDNWFVASCPILDIATQGESEKEVKENMRELIKDYLEDPDTYKPPLTAIVSASVSMTTIPVKINYAHGKTPTTAPA